MYHHSSVIEKVGALSQVGSVVLTDQSITGNIDLIYLKYFIYVSYKKITLGKNVL